jgi:hypothetical protein
VGLERGPLSLASTTEELQIQDHTFQTATFRQEVASPTRVLDTKTYWLTVSRKVTSTFAISASRSKFRKHVCVATTCSTSSPIPAFSRSVTVFNVFPCNPIMLAICTSTFSKLCKQRTKWHVEGRSVALLCK